MRRADGSEQQLRVREAAGDGRSLRVSLEGITDRTTAELLRGCLIEIERAELPPTGEREYYREDLIGFQVHNAAGSELGKVSHFVDGPVNALDAAPLTTIAAVHGVTFGGGFELALVCDIMIADRMARFCFPELRLGLIPGFGGIPRLKRDLGNSVVRDLLLTGRSFNVMKAQQIGLVSQIAAEGEALRVARATASQVGKFDRRTAAAAKAFVKPIPYEELKREIDIFCDLYSRPAVEEGLRRFVENEGPQPYLP